MTQCNWPGQNETMRAYHDHEWCVPSFDDTYIFEMLNLEGAQAGLSWSIVLAKRDEYKKAFRDFDIEYCLQLSDEELEKIRQDYADAHAETSNSREGQPRPRAPGSNN